jgi:hypothetical protein
MSIALFEKCLSITGAFEGASFGGAVGNFDGAGISAFILQWNLGQRTLQPLIADMYSGNPKLFESIAKDKSSLIVKTMLSVERDDYQAFVDEVTTGKDYEPVQNSTKYFRGKTSIKMEWKKIFFNLGNAFKDRQVIAAQKYFDAAIESAKQFGLKTERSLAFMFDQCVQRGRASIADELKEYKNQELFADERDVLKFILRNDLPDFSERWRIDVESRRMTIINGNGIVHGKNYDLDKDFGLSDAVVLL